MAQTDLRMVSQNVHFQWLAHLVGIRTIAVPFTSQIFWLSRVVLGY